MKRKAVLLIAVFGLTAASLALAGSSQAAGDAVYTTARDGAQRALSATFSLSATVVNWICDRCPETAAPETSPASSPCEGEA